MTFTVLSQRVYDLREHVLVNALSPQYVQMLIPFQFPHTRSARRQRTDHGFDIYENVPRAIQQQYRCLDVPRREARRTISVGRTHSTPKNGNIVIKHLKGRLPHDLEPVYHALDRGIREQVRVPGRFLGGSDVAVVPGNEEVEGVIEEGDHDGWVEDRLPSRD